MTRTPRDGHGASGKARSYGDTIAIVDACHWPFTHNFSLSLLVRDHIHASAECHKWYIAAFSNLRLTPMLRLHSLSTVASTRGFYLHAVSGALLLLSNYLRTGLNFNNNSKWIAKKIYTWADKQLKYYKHESNLHLNSIIIISLIWIELHLFKLLIELFNWNS